MDNRRSVIRNLILIDVIHFFVLVNFLKIRLANFDTRPTNYFKILIVVNLTNVSKHDVNNVNHVVVIMVIILIIINNRNVTTRNISDMILINVPTHHNYSTYNNLRTFHLTKIVKDVVQAFDKKDITTSFTF